MRVLKVPQTGAKRKLLDAAEGLVAEKGFDLVSVRDITGAVKANVAAVNYHFGSRDGLMDLVMMRSLEPLCDFRINALRNTQQATPSVSEIIFAYVESLVGTAAGIEMDRTLFLRLAGRILVLPDAALPPSLSFSRREVREKYLEALSTALSGTISEELSAAWDFFEAGIAQSLLLDNTTPEDWIEIGIRCLVRDESQAKAPKPGNTPAKESKLNIEKIETTEPAAVETQDAGATVAEEEPAEDKVVAFQDAETTAAEEKVVDITETDLAETEEQTPEAKDGAKPKKPKGKGGKDDSQAMLFDF